MNLSGNTVKQCLRIMLFLVALFLSQSPVHAQTRADSISTTWAKYIFHNDQNEVLLVYDTYYKAWELPGCGYEGPISLNNLMDSLAYHYGITYDSMKLGGIFTYTNPGRYRTSIKPYFAVHFSGYINGNSFRNPKRMKWVGIEEAMKTIPYPTMKLILGQLTKSPRAVWGGAFEEYGYMPPDTLTWKVVEPFYLLNQ